MASRRQLLNWIFQVSLLCLLRDGRVFAGDTAPGKPQITRAREIVALLVETPRDRILAALADRIHRGATREEVLAALALAAVEHVEPYPTVGFKYHAVMMLSQVYQTSTHSPESERWLPLLWAADVFKQAQQSDTYQGDWQLSSSVNLRLPKASEAEGVFAHAMAHWDAEAADAAITQLVRVSSARQIYAHLFALGGRDFRDIGHKTIAVGNSHRLLNIIGWKYAEPVLRSTVYALLNHAGEPNPLHSDLDADRAWHFNLEHARSFPSDWQRGRVDHQATLTVLAALRVDTYDTIGGVAIDLLRQGVHPLMLWDGIVLGAGELIMRASGIYSVHANTSVDALRFAYDHTDDDWKRRMLMLQGLSYITLFRDLLGTRGRQLAIDRFSPQILQEAEGDYVAEIFENVSRSRRVAAQKTLYALTHGTPEAPILARARHNAITRNTGYHDYKFAEAAFDNTARLSQPWRARYLSASVFYLNGTGDKPNPVVSAARQLLGSS